MSIDKIEDVKNKVLDLLNADENKEWIERYSGYSRAILRNEERILNIKSMFNEWSPLFVYMPVGEAASSGNTFQLRYKGQKVAALQLVKGDLFLKVDDETRKANKKYFNFTMNIDGKSWNSDEGTFFRNHFQEKEYNPRQYEHRIESLLLSEMEEKKKSNKQKTLIGIRPVKIVDKCRFQLCTPIAASDVANIHYSKKSKGAIDILSRITSNYNTRLGVIEIKLDDNKQTLNTLIQCIAYTTFLRELLRSQSGKEWYKIFGFNSELPSALQINSIVVLGGGKEQFDSWGQSIKIESDSFVDTINLHYIFYKEENGQLEITKSSLGEESK